MANIVGLFAINWQQLTAIDALYCSKQCRHDNVIKLYTSICRQKNALCTVIIAMYWHGLCHNNPCSQPYLCTLSISHKSLHPQISSQIFNVSAKCFCSLSFALIERWCVKKLISWLMLAYVYIQTEDLVLIVRIIVNRPLVSGVIPSILTVQNTLQARLRRFLCKVLENTPVFWKNQCQSKTRPQ